MLMVLLGTLLVPGIALTVFLHASGIATQPQQPTDDFLLCEDCHGAAPQIPTVQSEPMNSEERVAERMVRRLRERNIPAPTPGIVAKALQQKAALLQQAVEVEVTSSATHRETWVATLQHIPDAIIVNVGAFDAKVSIDAAALLQWMKENPSETHAVKNHVAGTTVSSRGLERLDAEGVATDGFEYDIEHAEAIVRAIQRGDTRVILQAPLSSAKIEFINADGSRSTLQKIASGKSNFESSPAEREINVLKALSEHVNLVVVRPGEEFSFNATLDGPVTLDKGWVEALGLFGGGAAPTPGGGICQAATTVYRAALMAGFPFAERRNHSLYVSYYERYGVGIDATIFPGVHDLRFVNDTGAPVVIQSYARGYDAYVDVFGIDDGRTVEVSGPYFATGAKRPAGMRALGWNDIGWTRTVRMADGSVRTQHLVSHYAKPVPRSLAGTYAPGILSYEEVPHSEATSMQSGIAESQL